MSSTTPFVRKFSLWMIDFDTGSSEHSVMEPGVLIVSAPNAYVARRKMMEAFENKEALEEYRFPFARGKVTDPVVSGPGYSEDAKYEHYPGFIAMLQKAYITRLDKEVICFFGLDG